MKLINKIIEPSKLLVIWQAPDKASAQATGKRFVVGEIIASGDSTKLKYYNNEETAQARKLGFNGLTAYPYESGKEYNGNLIDVLSRRLPPASRPDYEDYLKSYRIPAQLDISTLSLLAYTTGKLAGDGFTFAHTFDGINPPFDFTFEIAGFRHNDGMKLDKLESLQDVQVILKQDNTNKHDKDAVSVEYQDMKLGYIPHGINNIVAGFINKHNVSASIEKINGTIERPNILVYVTVK